MRKTRGMAMFNDGVFQVLNHSNTTSTMHYLGITQAWFSKESS